MTIQFSCDICGKTLSTSDDKAGRKAKCPGCGEMLVVPQPEGAVSDEEDMPLADESDALPVPRKRSSGGKVACPMCGEKVSRSASSCPSCGEALEPVRHDRAAEIELGNVFSTAWDTYAANLGYCVGGNLVAGILSIIGFIPMAIVFFIIFFEMSQQNRPEPSPGLLLLLLPAVLIGALTSLYFTMGVTRLFLKLARGDEAAFTEIFSGGPYFIPVMLFGFLVWIAVFFGFLLLIIPGLVLIVRIWPFWFVLAEARRSRWSCLSRAWNLTGPSWTVSLFLIVILAAIQFAMAIAGAIPFIGLIVSLSGLFISPFLHLLMATAYVQISHGEVPE